MHATNRPQVMSPTRRGDDLLRFLVKGALALLTFAWEAAIVVPHLDRAPDSRVDKESSHPLHHNLEVVFSNSSNNTIVVNYYSSDSRDKDKEDPDTRDALDSQGRCTANEPIVYAVWSFPDFAFLTVLENRTFVAMSADGGGLGAGAGLGDGAGGGADDPDTTSTAGTPRERGGQQGGHPVPCAQGAGGAGGVRHVAFRGAFDLPHSGRRRAGERVLGRAGRLRGDGAKRNDRREEHRV